MVRPDNGPPARWCPEAPGLGRLVGPESLWEGSRATASNRTQGRQQPQRVVALDRLELRRAEQRLQPGGLVVAGAQRVVGAEQELRDRRDVADGGHGGRIGGERSVVVE